MFYSSIYLHASRFQFAPRSPFLLFHSHFKMPAHLSELELGKMLEWAGEGKSPRQIHARSAGSRSAGGRAPPNITTIRRALRGITHKRGLKETRGRRPKLTNAQLRRLNGARKQLIRDAKGEDEVHLKDVMKKAAIRHVAPSTVSKHFSKYMGIRWRHPREEPLRQMLDMSERVSICRR